jgi:hypothetical protein
MYEVRVACRCMKRRDHQMRCHLFKKKSPNTHGKIISHFRISYQVSSPKNFSCWLTPPSISPPRDARLAPDGRGLGNGRKDCTYIHTHIQASLLFSSLPFPSSRAAPLMREENKTRQTKQTSQTRRDKQAEAPQLGGPAAAGAARERDRRSERASQRERESLAGVCYSEVREGKVLYHAVRCGVI